MPENDGVPDGKYAPSAGAVIATDGATHAPVAGLHALVDPPQTEDCEATVQAPQVPVDVLHAGVMPLHPLLLEHCTQRPAVDPDVEHVVPVAQGVAPTAEHATQVLVAGAHTGVAPEHAPGLAKVQAAHRLVTGSHAGVAPEHCASAVHGPH